MNPNSNRSSYAAPRRPESGFIQALHATDEQTDEFLQQQKISKAENRERQQRLKRTVATLSVVTAIIFQTANMAFNSDAMKPATAKEKGTIEQVKKEQGETIHASKIIISKDTPIFSSSKIKTGEESNFIATAIPQNFDVNGDVYIIDGGPDGQAIGFKNNGNLQTKNGIFGREGEEMNWIHQETDENGQNNITIIPDSFQQQE